MDNKNNYNQLVNSHQELFIEEDEQEEVFNDADKNKITEEKIDQIQPDIYHNSPSPTINSGLMDVYYNYPDNFIDDPSYFIQYICRLLI